MNKEEEDLNYYLSKLSLEPNASSIQEKENSLLIQHKTFSKHNEKALLLCVDILNYTTLFLDCNDFWNINFATKKVSQFVKNCKNSNIELMVFIDGKAVTQETLKKWRGRREKEVRKGERRVPQSTNILLGDLFSEMGVKVHYSVEADNDDTVAAFAHYYKGAILSKDRDFLRYIDAEYWIFTEFNYQNNNRINFCEQTQQYPKEGVSYRKIIFPLPKTSKNFEEFMIIRSSNDMYTYMRGAPTSLVYRYGNPHIEIKALRQALYKYLKIEDKIKEIFPTWNFKINDVEWYQDITYSDGEIGNYLYKPHEAVKYFFPYQKKPRDLTWSEWNNHLYALHIIIFELCSVAMKVPVIKLLRESPYFNELYGNKIKHSNFMNPKPYLNQNDKYYI